MQRRGTSRHLCIYIISYLVLFLRGVFIAFYVFPLHVNEYAPRCFKQYYNDENHLVLKYEIINLSKGLLHVVLEHKSIDSVFVRCQR